jgi:4-hydroxybenzoate polyprenyltransferase
MFFLRLVRYKNLIILILMVYLARLFLIKTYTSSIFYLLVEKEIFIITTCITLTAAAGYVINDYYDIKIDLINEPKRVIIGKYMSRRWSLVLHSIFNIVSIAIAAIYLSINVAIFVSFCAFLLWLYSNYLKRTVFWGNFCVSFMALAPFVLIGLYYQRNKEYLFFFALVAFLTTFIREIVKDIEDMKGDQLHGCKTLPIVLGIPNTKKIVLGILTVVWIVLIFSFLVVAKRPFIYFSFICIPCWIFFGIRLLIADKKNDFTKLSKYAKVFMFLGILGMILM